MYVPTCPYNIVISDISIYQKITLHFPSCDAQHFIYFLTKTVHDAKCQVVTIVETLTLGLAFQRHSFPSSSIHLRYVPPPNPLQSLQYSPEDATKCRIELKSNRTSNQLNRIQFSADSVSTPVKCNHKYVRIALHLRIFILLD